MNSWLVVLRNPATQEYQVVQIDDESDRRSHDHSRMKELLAEKYPGYEMVSIKNLETMGWFRMHESVTLTEC
jgi:hypothetical protein